MSNKYVNIFKYADFRKYLNDYHIERQKSDKAFTRSKFCKVLGLPKTRSFITDIINGKNLSPNYVERFVLALNLNEDEAQYFRTLVNFNQSLITSERDLLFDQLISLNKTPKQFVSKENYGYYSKWYHSAIFTLLDITDFNHNYKALAAKLYPPISPKQAKESIQLLKKLGLIEKNKKGFFKGTCRTLSAGEYIQHELVKQYQLQCLELAKQALLKNETQKQNISTMTISISEVIQPKIELKIQKFKSEIRSMVHKDDHQPNQVYQLNLQYFPQSK